MKQLLPIIEAGPANLVLNLLNQYSHSVVEGVDAQLLKYQSQGAGLDESALAAALQGLLETGLVNLLPGPLMSLRLSPSAFARVQQVALEAHEAAVELDEPQDWDGLEPPAPTAGPGAFRTELQLREQVMQIFGALKISAQGRLAAHSLSVIWREAQHRADELRHAVDLLQRDGYLKVQREHGVASMILTAQGYRFTQGRAAPQALFEAAPPAREQDRVCRSMADDDWLDLAAQELLRHDPAARTLMYEDLQRWFDDLSLLPYACAHALDLWHRYGLADLAAPEPLRLMLTDAGRQRLQECKDSAVRRRVSEALRAADHQLGVS